MAVPTPSPPSAIALTAAQRKLLDVLLDLIIPASEDGRLPGAGTFDVWAYIAEKAPASQAGIVVELERLAAHAHAQLGKPLEAAPHDERAQLLEAQRAEQPDLLAELARHTVACYYQQDTVLKAIGMEARPPYPKGYTVLAGDLGLLDPVRKRGSIYRDAGET